MISVFYRVIKTAGNCLPVAFDREVCYCYISHRSFVEYQTPPPESERLWLCTSVAWPHLYYHTMIIVTPHSPSPHKPVAMTCAWRTLFGSMSGHSQESMCYASLCRNYFVRVCGYAVLMLWPRWQATRASEQILGAVQFTSYSVEVIQLADYIVRGGSQFP